MIDFTIKAENETIKNAFTNFIFNYKDHIVDYMNQIVGNDGSPIDSGIVVANDQITLYHIAPDKGFVLAQTAGDAEIPLQIQKYSELPNDFMYLAQEKGKLNLYLKQPQGEVDILMGSFNSLNDSIKGIGSEQVKQQLEKVEAMKKTKEKELRRLKRLGKVTEDAIEVQVVDTNE